MEHSRTSTWRNFRLTREPEALDTSNELETAEPDEIEPLMNTFFDAGATFEGTLKLSGDFRIDSEFRGKLATDGTIIVGESGSVEGKIKAHQVEIEGAVVGDVHARRMLVLRATGRLHGDVETACLEVERHGFFEGATKMLRPLDHSRPRIDPESVESESNPASSAPIPPTT